MIDNTEYLAERLANVSAELAPRFGRVASKWSEKSGDDKRLIIAAIRIVLSEMPTGGASQTVEFDRNHWQRKVGALLDLIDSFTGIARAMDGGQDLDAEDVRDLRNMSERLLGRAVAVVNSSWHSGKTMDDPHADIAMLTFRETVKMAVRAGIVVPNPNSVVPEWLQE